MGQEEEEGRGGEDYEDNDEAQYGSASPHDNLGRCQEKSLLHNRVTFFLRFAIFFLNLLLHPVVVFYESFAWLLACANRQTSLATARAWGTTISSSVAEQEKSFSRLWFL